MFKGGMKDLMKQAQAMQEDMQKIQEEVANTEVIGNSGAGLVSVTMTGRHDVLKINIDPSLLTEEKEILEDLIAAAVNDAVRKVATMSEEKMGSAMGAMGGAMPEGFKFPF